jgi:hypothetical protein
MATMDVFKQKPFQMVELSAAVQRAPYNPQFLGQLGIFGPKRIRTTSFAIESKGGTLSLIQTSERGAPLSEGSREKREIRDFRTRRIAKGHTLSAAEIQNIRAFGQETEFQQVQSELADIMNGATGLRASVEITHEHMRLGAVQGVVTDADGSTIYDWFSEWGVSQDAEINFDLAAASPASGAVRKLCNQVVRQTMKNAAGAWVPGQTYIMGLCGDAFWDDLTAHKEVRETYLNQVAAQELRNGVGTAYGMLQYGNITFVNYRGTDDGTTVGINTDKVKFFPVSAPGVFECAYSPAEFMPFVNTAGQDVYAIVVADDERQAWVRPELYSYPMHYCTRPKMLQRGRRT